MTARTPWWEVSDPLSAHPLPRETDLAIVGGGVMGLVTGLALARAGLQPLILEREGPGAGATGRNGGFVALGTTESYQKTTSRFGPDAARQLLELTLVNRDVAEVLIAEESIDCDFRNAGLLHLSLSLEESSLLQTESTQLNQAGCRSDWFDRNGVQTQVGTPLGERVVGGVLTPGSALVHSGKLVRGLAGAAERRGARLAQAQVLDVEPAGGRIRIVTDRGAVLAEQALLAVNAWTGSLVPSLRAAIVPVRGQMLAYVSTAPVFRCGMTAMWTETEEYWQQAMDGSILLGGCRAAASGGDENVESLDPTPEVQRALEAVLPGLFPALGPLPITHRWAGPMAFTRDRLPLVGPLTGLPGCWVAGGFSGHGMAMAFALGEMVAAALRTGASDPRRVHFSPDRFAGAGQ